MGRGWKRWLPGLLVLAGWAGISLGQSPGGSTLTEEIEQVLQEWEASDLPPSAEQQAQWLEELESAQRSGKGSIKSGWKGLARWRGYFRDPGREKWDGRLDVTAGPARVKVRLGRDLTGARILGGALELEGRPGRIVVGYLGLEAGAGLLLARPGRGRTLVADGNLSRVRSRLAGWTGIQENRTVQGVGVATRFRRFNLNIMAGNLCLPDTGFSPGIQAWTLSWVGRPSFLALSGLYAGSGRGLGLWGKVQNAFLEGAGEVACWQPRNRMDPLISWQAVVSCQPTEDWFFQGGVASGSGGPGSPLAVRSPLLKGDQGHGWAFRGAWRSRQGVRMTLLATESSFRTGIMEPGRELVRAWDIMATVRTAPTVSLSARLRTTSQQRWEWSDRYRWQPATLVHRASRIQGQVRLAWTPMKNRSLFLTGRFIQKGSPAASPVRALIGVHGLWNLNPEVQLRCGYGAAWGDPLDLVSAISPLPGLVVARHWGSWQSESFVGLGVRQWGWRFRGAVSFRRSTPLAEYQDSIQVWLESGWVW